MNHNNLNRTTKIDLSAEEFKKIGHELVERIAEFIGTIDSIPVTRAENEETIRKFLGSENPLPEIGLNANDLIRNTTDLLINHSLFNGHPKFWGYITSSPAPLGMLGDLLASAINQNVGAWNLSPMASEIEAQTIRWIASLIGFPTSAGLIVSGGNVANYIGFLAAFRAKTGLEIRNKGINSLNIQPAVYCSAETHTWIQKAADLFGLGTDCIRWIKTNKNQKMDMLSLKNTIEKDKKSGFYPMLVVGTAGSVSTGAIDPLNDIAELCQDYNLWFHIDGAYGGFAAAVPELEEVFHGIEKADSIAIDPHKWLYAPLEAGCVLVKNPEHLTNTFSYHPPYYNFEQSAVNYVDYGIQNSRGFKALKVWLMLQQMGRKGYQDLIREDISLAKYAHNLLSGSKNIETFACNLSITTFRYVPEDFQNLSQNQKVEDYLNELNRTILEKIEKSGKFFLSNAIINEKFLLRMCIVNFRTKAKDIELFSEFLLETGPKIDTELRSNFML